MSVPKHDPATVATIVEYRADRGVHPLLRLILAGGECGGRITHTPERGDGGDSAGSLQMNAIHGHEPDYWEGLDGLRRSLDRALGVTGEPGPPDWPGAVRTMLAKYGEFDGTTFWVTEFWILAQACNRQAAIQNAPMALQAGREAWAEYQARQAHPPQEDPVSTPTPALRRKAVPRPPIREILAHPNNYTPAARRSDGGLANVALEGMTAHTSGGGATIQALIAWFQNPNQITGDGSHVNVSTRFGIGPDAATGEIWFVQFVRDEDLPHSQSLGSNPTAPLVLENLALGYRNPSAYLDGCELTDAGVPGNHSIAQLDAFAWLTAYRFDTRYFPGGASGVEATRHNILGHYEISDDRQLCPNFTPQEWEYVVRKTNEWLYEEAEAPADPRDATIAHLKGQIVALRDDLTVIRDDYDRWAEAATAYAEHATKTAAHLSGIIAGL